MPSASPSEAKIANAIAAFKRGFGDVQAIGAILAHTNTKTTGIYTVGAQRRILADLALAEMRNFSL